MPHLELMGETSPDKRLEFIDDLFRHSAGRAIIGFLGRTYLAGHSIEEVLKTAEEFHRRGRNSTIDVLGERAGNRQEADQYMDAYKTIIDSVSSSYKQQDVASISVKPTAICAVGPDNKLLPETPLDERIEELVDYAEKKGVKVTLDMEDINWTGISIEAARYIWSLGHRNFGIVLQSRLNRTQEDIRRTFNSSAYQINLKDLRARIVTGAYRESYKISTNGKAEIKERFVERAKELFESGVYVEIATHDHAVINRLITEVIEPGIKSGKIKKDSFEFQFLKGVQNAYDIDESLIASGYKVRYYLPVELKKGDSVSYMGRRLKENPDLLSLGYKNMKDRARNFFFSSAKAA